MWICRMGATGRDRSDGTLLPRSLWHDRYLGYRITGTEFILVDCQSSREHTLAPGSQA